jgi:hypothetical protein
MNGLVYTAACVVSMLVGYYIGTDNAKHATAEGAAKLCEETGGQLLVTEYNSKTGLTMNCFYPVDDSIVAPALMDL